MNIEKKIKGNTIHKLTFLVVVQRVIGFPFFASISFIGAMALWLKWIFNFAKYGGEAIAYTEKTNRKTIHEVFLKLTDNNDVT